LVFAFLVALQSLLAILANLDQISLNYEL